MIPDETKVKDTRYLIIRHWNVKTTEAQPRVRRLEETDWGHTATWEGGILKQKMYCVCVCVRAHAFAHTCSKNKTKNNSWSLLLYSLFCKSVCVGQSVAGLSRDSMPCVVALAAQQSPGGVPRPAYHHSRYSSSQVLKEPQSVGLF